MCVCGGIIEVGIFMFVVLGATDFVRRALGYPPLTRRHRLRKAKPPKPHPVGTLGE